MKLTKYETVMLYVIGFLDVVENAFVKYFRVTATAFGIMYLYALFGGMDRRKIEIEDLLPAILPVAIVIGVLALIYEILVLKNRIRNKRRNHHVSKHY